MNNDLISRSALLEEMPKNDEIFSFEVRRVICNAPAVDAEVVRHGTWEHVKKHLWYKNDSGEVDMWRLDHGFHNGPECEVCGKCFCGHCEPDWAENECEIGYYVCSECKQPTKTGDSNYCPNCGVKMRGDDGASE